MPAPTYETLAVDSDGGVARIWLNRPDVRNALNATLIAELGTAIRAAVADPAVRVIVLGGRGKAFCAGGDLNWMRSAREMSPEEARADSANLANVMRALYESPKPCVARVHGSAFAGAMGLVAACDIAIASARTKFCLSEVKLGLIPSMIGPYVIRAIGERQSRRYMLSAEVFDAAQAQRIGLVSQVVADDGEDDGQRALDTALDAMLAHLLAASPQALDACKRLIHDIVDQPIGDAVTADTAARIAAVRASDDAQEGIAAFFARRAPRWAPGSR